MGSHGCGGVFDHREDCCSSAARSQVKKGVLDLQVRKTDQHQFTSDDDRQAKANATLLQKERLIAEAWTLHLRQYHGDWTEIGRQLNVNPKTAKKYVHIARKRAVERHIAECKETGTVAEMLSELGELRKACWETVASESGNARVGALKMIKETLETEQQLRGHPTAHSIVEHRGQIDVDGEVTQVVDLSEEQLANVLDVLHDSGYFEARSKELSGAEDDDVHSSHSDS